MMKQYWWKILTVLILLYVFIVGLSAPLGQGITSTSPTMLTSGNTVVLKVEGYNTSFTQGKNEAWLKLDSAHSIAAKSVEVIDDNHLTMSYILPNELPNNVENAPATLVVNNTVKGYAIYPGAASIQANQTIDSTNTAIWTTIAYALTENTDFDFPFRNILVETIRNLYFHVPLWFGMIIILLVAMIQSIKYLRNDFDFQYDIKARAYVQVGFLFGILGILTGGIWAKFTWGEFWSFDIKQNMTAVALLIYSAYFLLRVSFEDEQQKAKLAAIYNIFAFVSLIPLLFVIPRMYDSLHPGNGGNPAFGGEDLDNTMRTVFYPAVIGFTLLGAWIANLLIRVENIKRWWIEKMF